MKYFFCPEKAFSMGFQHVIVFFDERTNCTNEGKRCILRYSEEADEWTLQSGFDGDDLLMRSGINVITIDAEVIRRLEKTIIACEHCHPNDAEIPFAGS